MKPKHLIICALLLAVLIIAITLQSLTRQKPAGELGLVKLTGSVDINTIEKIKFYMGDDIQNSIELVKAAGKWLLATKFNAPARNDMVETLLSELKELKGEMRSNSSELFTEFSIGDKDSIHIELIGASEITLSHLLIGKQAADNLTTFLRLSGETKTYAVTNNLRRALGIFQPTKEEAREELKPLKWLDTQVFRGLNTDEICKISTTSPGRRLVFEKKQIEQLEDSEKKEEEKTPEKTEWIISKESAPAPFSIKQDGVDRLIRQIENFRAEDAVEPEKGKSCSFENPEFSAIISFKDNSEKKLLICKAPGEEDDFYAKIDKEAVIWKVKRWAIDSLFRDARILFDLELLKIDEGKLTKIKLTDPAKQIVFEKNEGGAWKITEPQTPFEQRDKTIDSIIKRVISYTPDDFINLPAETNFDTPEYSIEYTSLDNTTQTVLIGSNIPERDKERYLKIAGIEGLFTIKEHNVFNNFPSVANFLDIKLFDCDKDKISMIKISKSDGDFLLEKKGKDESGFECALYGYEFAAKVGAVRPVLNLFSNLKPTDVVGEISDEKSGLNTPDCTLTLKSETGEELTVLIGKKVEKGYFAKTTDSPIVYILSDKACDYVLKPVEDIINMKIFTFDPKTVSKISLQAGGKEVSFEQKNSNDWTVLSPEGKKPNAAAVSVLFSVVVALTAHGISAPRPLAEVGLESPEKSLTLVTKNGMIYTLEIGNQIPENKEKIFAKLKEKDGILHLETASIQRAFPDFNTLFAKEN
ncbi:MAG: DUF4340 domain-containing protein [Planctomycetota bacterium]